MSIEAEVGRLGYLAAQPEIDAAYEAIACAIVGRDASTAIIALVRALAASITIIPEGADERSIETVTAMLRSNVTAFRRIDQS
jgi:hypothetical protein